MNKIIKIVRYVISGGTAAVIDLSFLYLFVEYLKIWYLLSAVIAFLIAFTISFTLQKFWTFKDKSVERMHTQATLYLIVSLINLGLNTFFIYLFVEYAHFHYFFSQFITGALLAVSSFFVYSLFIFKPLPAESSSKSEEAHHLE